MCKLLLIPTVKPSLAAKAWKLISAAVKPLSKNDKDGLGYMAVGDSGLFGERWLDNSKAFKVRTALSPEDSALAEMLGDAVDVEESYNSFGRVDVDSFNTARSIALHTRYATCSKGLANTHPFVSESTALIHNGVISNAHELTNITSTCDSEVILNEYVDARVNESPEQIEEVVAALKGYFACAVLSKDEGGSWIMDIFKDSRASLFVAYIPALETHVYCTSAALLREACKAARFRMGMAHEIQAGRMIRYDVDTGTVRDVIPFKMPPAATTYVSNYTPITAKNSVFKAPEKDEEEEDAGMWLNADWPAVRKATSL